MCNGLSRDGDDLRVHGMLVGISGLHRQECSCADMEGQFVGLNAPSMEVSEDGFGKMQAGCGRSDRTFDARINGLVGLEIRSFGLAVQVGRNGQFPCGIKNLREGDVISVPLKTHGEGISQSLLLIGA